MQSVLLSQGVTKTEFDLQILQKIPNKKFTKCCPVGAELFNFDTRIDGQA